jgi:glycosyltransferase involved in cell wall biosynthesis
MLRHYEQHEGGVRIYTQNLLPRLFSMDSKNTYVLMYQNPNLLGTYSAYPNVEEVVLSIPGKILWDQLAVPWIAKKKRLDLVFNPKFTIPFLCRARKVFVLHGSDWFVIPEGYPWYDRWYFRKSVPLYCRYADAFISVSHATKKDVVRFTGVDPDKVIPIYHGFDHGRFHVIQDIAVLETVGQKYQLPKQFILWVGQIYPTKNFGRLLQAFSQIKDKIPHQLVIVGEHLWGAEDALQMIRDLKIHDRVLFTGWVSHDDLPALYNLAELFVMPSLYEGFGIPLLEAMACGCPVLTSKTASPPEVMDGAAYLVDPLEVNEIAKGTLEVLSSFPRREEMIKRGLQRVKSFSWESCAKKTLAVLESQMNGNAG